MKLSTIAKNIHDPETKKEISIGASVITILSSIQSKGTHFFTNRTVGDQHVSKKKEKGASYEIECNELQLCTSDFSRVGSEVYARGAEGFEEGGGSEDLAHLTGRRGS